MALQTRKPTGRPSWSTILLAGVEKSGKSWACAEASASPVLGCTLWIGIGEDDPDEYGAVPGANFDIVEHDGSYQGILWAFRDAVTAPLVDGKPTLLVGDSMTRLWNLIVGNAQATANRRAKGKKKAGTEDYTITPDLWNTAAQQWKDVMDAVRAHRGPVLLTARLDEVAIMEGGSPTGERTWKVQGHKSLPYDVTAVVQMRERGQFLLTGVRSVRMGLQEPLPVKGWTAQGMWQNMGIDPTTVGDRRHSDTVVDEGDDATSVPRPAQQQLPAAPAQQQQAAPAAVVEGRDWDAELAALTSIDQVNPLWKHVPADYPDRNALREKFRAVGISLRSREQQQEPPADPGWAQAPGPQEPPEEPEHMDAPPEDPAASEAEPPATEAAPQAAPTPAAGEAPPAWQAEAAELRARAEAKAAEVLAPGEPMALDGVSIPEPPAETNGHTR
jgi:hypothetical protein